MTIRTITSTATTITADPFPDYPPRDDMQNFLHLSRPSHMKSLERFFASRPSVSVVSEVPVSQRYGDYVRVRIPDLMVSFNSDLDMMVEHNGYTIDRQGSPPDFALEIASVSTAARDEDEKRADYALFGIPEYWRFDPTGGERYEAALAGDRLADDGSYRPGPVEWLDDDRCRGWSEALGLYVCWSVEACASTTQFPENTSSRTTEKPICANGKEKERTGRKPSWSGCAQDCKS